jgi:hypothetical protein
MSVSEMYYTDEHNLLNKCINFLLNINVIILKPVYCLGIKNKIHEENILFTDSEYIMSCFVKSTRGGVGVRVQSRTLGTIEWENYPNSPDGAPTPTLLPCFLRNLILYIYIHKIYTPYTLLP